MTLEYRVTWQREGLDPARCFRQTEAGARAKVEHLRWAEEDAPRGSDPEGGSDYGRVPRLINWKIEARPVGPWFALIEEHA